MNDGGIHGLAGGTQYPSIPLEDFDQVGGDVAIVSETLRGAR
ncbi:MAG: hypothetical protein AAGF84_15245 [Planctomycetota bacterium]